MSEGKTCICGHASITHGPGAKLGASRGTCLAPGCLCTHFDPGESSPTKGKSLIRAGTQTTRTSPTTNTSTSKKPTDSERETTHWSRLSKKPIKLVSIGDLSAAERIVSQYDEEWAEYVSGEEVSQGLREQLRGLGYGGLW